MLFFISVVEFAVVFGLKVPLNPNQPIKL